MLFIYCLSKDFNLAVKHVCITLNCLTETFEAVREIFLLAKLSQGNTKHKSVTKLRIVVKVFIILLNMLKCSRKDSRMCHKNYGNGLLQMFKTPINKETGGSTSKFRENNNWRHAIKDIIQLMKNLSFPPKYSIQKFMILIRLRK